MLRLGGGGGGNVVAVVDIVIVEALSDDSRGRFLDAEVALFPSTALVVVEVLVAPAEAEAAEVAVVGPPLDAAACSPVEVAVEEDVVSSSQAAVVAEEVYHY